MTGVLSYRIQGEIPPHSLADVVKIAKIEIEKMLGIHSAVRHDLFEKDHAARLSMIRSGTEEGILRSRQATSLRFETVTLNVCALNL